MRMKNTEFWASIILAALFMPFTSLFAAPTVNGTIISWPDDGWYQVQTQDDFTSICDGGLSCEVEPGTYIVINHTTGERFPGVVVDATGEPGIEAPTEPPVDDLMITGNTISWPDDGWYEVQNSSDYLTVCAGGRSCTVPQGSYTIINHTTGFRRENVVIETGAEQFGLPLQLGDGTFNAYYYRDTNGNPDSLGVQISATAFDNSPTMPSDGSYDIIDASGEVVFPCCGYELVLPMPIGSEETPFKQIVVNFNPHGHIPPGIYNVPHMDFHFYLIDELERQAIDAPTAEDRCPIPDSTELAVLNCEDYETALLPVPGDTLAPGYQSVGALEPSMGNHLLDLTSPEFNGLPFTHTWIYGSWNGKIHFFEPMVTIDYLRFLNHNKTCVHYPVASAQPTAGWYPTKYCMEYLDESDNYRISLERWREFDASSESASN